MLINVDQPTVVRQIQQLQRLETVSYTMDKIISGEHANAYLPKFLAGDRLLLVVHGEVVAGINLAGVQPGDARLNQVHHPDSLFLDQKLRTDNQWVHSCASSSEPTLSRILKPANPSGERFLQGGTFPTSPRRDRPIGLRG